MGKYILGHVHYIALPFEGTRISLVYFSRQKSDVVIKEHADRVASLGFDLPTREWLQATACGDEKLTRLPASMALLQQGGMGSLDPGDSSSGSMQGLTNATSVQGWMGFLGIFGVCTTCRVLGFESYLIIWDTVVPIIGSDYIVFSGRVFFYEQKSNLMRFNLRTQDYIGLYSGI